MSQNITLKADIKKIIYINNYETVNYKQYLNSCKRVTTEKHQKIHYNIVPMQ